MSAAFVTIKLREPVQFGRDSEPVTELELRPNGRAMRDLQVKMGQDGSLQLMVVEPYALCRVGLRMAGIAGDQAFVDKMDPRDIWEVAQEVVGFFMAARPTGS